VLSLKTGQRKTVQRGGYFGRYLSSGHLVYLRGSTLFAVPFDPDKLETTGTPAPVLQGIAANVEFGGGQFDFSRNGTLVFLSGKAVANTTRTIFRMDVAGKTEPIAPPGNYSSFRLSPDGKRLALVVMVPKQDLWVSDLKRETLLQITFNGGLGTMAAPSVPVWTPDGKHLVYHSDNSIRWIRADGAGEPQILLQSTGVVSPYSFSPDGRRLAYYSSADNQPDLWTLPLDTSDPEHPKAGKPEPFLQTPAVEIAPVFSPDGRWIAYSSNESGLTDVFVRPFAAGSAPTGKWKISNATGRYPVWSRAAKQLLYRSLDGAFMVVDYTIAGDVFQAGRPRPWAHSQPAYGGGAGSNPVFDSFPDGKHLAIPGELSQAEQQPKGNVHVTFLVHWFDDLSLRVPATR